MSGAGTRVRMGELVWLTALTDFRRRYAQTRLGYAWVLLGPLLYFGVIYAFISEIVQRFVGEIPDYAVLLLFNLTLYMYFRQATQTAMRSLVAQGGIVRQMPLPRIALPASTMLSAAFLLAANLVLVLVWALAAGVGVRWTWLLLPVVIAWLALITAGASLLLAGAFVGSRDVGQVWPVILRALFFATPIMFPLEVIPKEVLWEALSFNPLAPLFAQARVWIIDPAAPSWFDAKGTGIDGLLPFALTIVLCGAGWIVFRRGARRAAERL